MLKRFFLLLLLPCMLGATPLPMEAHGLEWDKKHSHIPYPTGYKYYYGDVSWGLVVYLGSEDFLGLETELQLNFTDTRRIAKALLILGPGGISKADCLKKYKLIVDLLSKKYGNYRNREVIKDSISEDMVFDSVCNVILNGVHEIKTIWLLKEYEITAKLLGDYEGFFIEIDYVKLNRNKQLKKDKLKKSLRSL